MWGVHAREVVPVAETPRSPTGRVVEPVTAVPPAVPATASETARPAAASPAASPESMAEPGVAPGVGLPVAGVPDDGPSQKRYRRASTSVRVNGTTCTGVPTQDASRM